MVAIATVIYNDNVNDTLYLLYSHSTGTVAGSSDSAAGSSGSAAGSGCGGSSSGGGGGGASSV